MTGIVVAGVFVALAGCIAWSRLASARAEKRSVDDYEHVLGVLGHVAKRSEASANVHVPTEDDLARPHVRASDESNAFRPFPGQFTPTLPARVRLTPPNLPGQRVIPRFGDDELASLSTSDDQLDTNNEQPAFVSDEIAQAYDTFNASLESEPVVRFDDLDSSTTEVVGEPFVTSDVSATDDSSTTQPSVAELASIEAARHVNRRRGSSNREGHSSRRAVTGAAALVVVGALAVGSWQLAGQSSHAPGVNTGSTTTHRGPSSRSTSQNALGSMVIPVSSSNGVVTYDTVSGLYTIGFKATGECWLGVESAVTPNGPWLTMKTLTTGETWSYNATGPLVVRIGAPLVLTVTINGVPVELTGGSNAYDISFAASDSTSA